MLNIDGTTKSGDDHIMPLFRLGFRPFFLAAGLFAVISMMIWMASYLFSIDFGFAGMSPVTWHAHEMLFGYAVAVIAGFLLTAIKNWTGVEVIRGKPLMLLSALWLIARVLPLSGLKIPMALIAVVDVSFMFALALVCLRPVLIVKQYKHLGIISVLFLLMLCNALFYMGLSGAIEQGVLWGIYSAIYMIITLVLLMMRRVMPMFIANGVDGDVDLTNRAWVDRWSMIALFCLMVSDVFTDFGLLTAFFASVLTLLHIIRLSGWYTRKIWSKPLVWVLVLAYAFFIIGFALKAISILSDVSPFLSVHAFTVGGIGVVTIGMMSRVSLGHTGRDVFVPPPSVFWILLLLLLGAVVRVIFPLLSMELYNYWIAVSQLFWIAAFTWFLFVYAPMLVKPRADGRDG